MTLVVVDGTQRVWADGHGGVDYTLAVRVDGIVTRTSAALLGPAVNELYAQALSTVLADPSLGGLACDVREGAQDGDRAGLGLDLSLNRESPAAPAAAFGLHLLVRYWQPTGQPSKREPILAALTAAVNANVPGVGLCVRERVLSTFHAHLASVLAPLEIVRNADRPQRLGPGADRIVLVDGDQGVEHLTLNRTDYMAMPSVEVFVASTSTAALDARLQQVRDAIRSADAVLRAGDLADDVEEDDVDPEVLREAYSGSALAASVGARITFATMGLSPYEVA